MATVNDLAIHMPESEPHQLHPREYTFWHGDLYARVPYSDHHIRMTANLSGHEVTKHDDGTITVSPSILVTDGAAGHSWHGFLERGIWLDENHRPCSESDASGEGK
jgi:hypothetical protein